MNTSTGGVLIRKTFVNLPQPLWLMLFALALGLAHGFDAPALIKAFGVGFGSALGSFALILIPSFVLAACFARQTLSGAPRVASAIAPVTAAGMVCPDTAYAALSSVAKHRKLSVAFGSYAGYRLLFPAGPLLAATGLGIDSAGLLMVGLALLVPVWLSGELWAHYRTQRWQEPLVNNEASPSGLTGELSQALLPLVILAALLIYGGIFKPVTYPLIDFITRPKGALLVAAAISVWMTDPKRRKEALEVAMNRSASLLLVIGAASAFGLMLTTALPIDHLLPQGTAGTSLLFALFAFAVLFKLAYGSSTVALATVTSVLAPVVVPLIDGGVITPAAAVFAICLGTLVIVPTDSYYWLVRSDALADVSEKSAIVTLGGGAALQAVVGLLVLATIAAMNLA